MGPPTVAHSESPRHLATRRPDNCAHPSAILGGQNKGWNAYVDGEIADNMSSPLEVTAASSGDREQAVEEESNSASIVQTVQAEPLEQRSHQQHVASHLTCCDDYTVESYFSYYGKLSNQMNMLQDSVRTSLYHQAISRNPTDFAGKTVMDVGAGSGILSFFAAMAGASRVVAVEGSDVTETFSALVQGNEEVIGPNCDIKVLRRLIEKVTSDDLMSIGVPCGDADNMKFVDALVSEPIGTFLFNERMIESYLHARDVFLKPGGKMFPSKLRLVMAPFTDAYLYQDMVSRAQFWNQKDFYGIDLCAALPRAIMEQFKQPIIDHIDPRILLTSCWHKEFDLYTLQKSELEKMLFEFRFEFHQPCLVHGIAGWFDVLFDGSDFPLAFSTAPWFASTHWFQIRYLLMTPLAVNPGQVVNGTLVMTANKQQSYDININVQIEGTFPPVHASSATVDLKDPDYRYCSNPSASYYNTAGDLLPKDAHFVEGAAWESLLVPSSDRG